MDLFDWFRLPDIDRGVEECRSTPGAVLLDVRTVLEYRERHIPGSQNIPLQVLDNAEYLIKNKDIPLFVHCHSGARSRQAVELLRRKGYSNDFRLDRICDSARLPSVDNLPYPYRRFMCNFSVR